MRRDENRESTLGEIPCDTLRLMPTDEGVRIASQGEEEVIDDQRLQ
jgi:hypothetical protein